VEKITKTKTVWGFFMLANLQTFEAEALTLPASERALLAQHLLASLDDTDEQENEQLWLDEAQRRYNAYKNGTVSSRNAFEAIVDMRGQL
jgi:putative addiction module component (TIGR02574 family)